MTTTKRTYSNLSPWRLDWSNESLLVERDSRSKQYQGDAGRQLRVSFLFEVHHRFRPTLNVKERNNTSPVYVSPPFPALPPLSSPQARGHSRPNLGEHEKFHRTPSDQLGGRIGIWRGTLLAESKRKHWQAALQNEKMTGEDSYSGLGLTGLKRRFWTWICMIDSNTC